MSDTVHSQSYAKANEDYAKAVERLKKINTNISRSSSKDAVTDEERKIIQVWNEDLADDEEPLPDFIVRTQICHLIVAGLVKAPMSAHC